MVKERLAHALKCLRGDSELIGQLQPTHIITQTQCKVCAVSLEDVESALQEQTGDRCQSISLEPYALARPLDGYCRVADACGCVDRAQRLIGHFSSVWPIFEARAEPAERPRVAAIEWLEPLMAGGNWVPELIEMAGGENLFGEAGQHSPWMTWEELIDADPDVIVALPCGFDLARTRSEMHWLTERAEWAQLEGCAERPVYHLRWQSIHEPARTPVGGIAPDLCARCFIPSYIRRP